MIPKKNKENSIKLLKKRKTYVNASVASSREPNSAYHIGGLPRGVFSCSSRIGTTGLKN